MPDRAEQALPEIIKRLVEAAHPRQLILFGSRARGTQREDSDLDILVVEKSVASPYKEMVRLRRVLRGFALPIDVLVVSVGEFQARSANASTVYYWAKKEGKVLYDAA